MIKRAQGSMNERKQRGSVAIRKGQQFPILQPISYYTAKFSNEKQRALCYFWDDGDARFGVDPLGWVCCPTRFQECVIFHFLLTGNRPEMAETGITQRRRRVERI